MRPPRTDSVEESEQLSVLALINVLLRRWKLVVLPPLVLLAFVTLSPIVREPLAPQYRAETTLEVEGGSSAGSSNPVAEALGIKPSLNTAGFPYAKELKSREFLSQMLEERFSFPADGAIRSGTLMSFGGIEGRTAKRREKKARDWLLSSVTFVPDPDGTTHMFVEMPWPALAESVSVRLVHKLNDRIVRRRQERVSRDRFYTLQILRAMQDSMDRAERRVETFVQRNRQYSNSPALQNEYNSLQRDFSIRQSMYSTLLSQYEGARIEEVRATRMIMVLDPPYVPDQDPPRRWLVPPRDLVKVAFLLMATVFLAFVVEFVAAAGRRNPAEYAEFLALRARTFGRISRLFRRDRRSGPRNGELSVR